MSSVYAARRSVMPKQRQPAPRRSQRPRPTPAARGTTDRVGSKGDEAKSPNEATTGAAADAVVAELRIGPGKQGAVATVRGTPRLIELAAKWMYILRNRSRWAKDDNLKINIGETAKDDLAELGIDEAAVMKICDSELRHVEVTFFDDHPTSRTSSPAQAAAMAFPWEFVLSSATRKGRAETLLVTRLLLRDRPRRAGVPRQTALRGERAGATAGVLLVRVRTRTAPGRHRPTGVGLVGIRLLAPAPRADPDAYAERHPRLGDRQPPGGPDHPRLLRRPRDQEGAAERARRRHDDAAGLDGALVAA